MNEKRRKMLTLIENFPREKNLSSKNFKNKLFFPKNFKKKFFSKKCPKKFFFNFFSFSEAIYIYKHLEILVSDENFQKKYTRFGLDRKAT